MTPVVENDMPKASYHGYALTDYYNTDRRYGTLEEYQQFVDKAHQNGLKVVHDVVLNHMGSGNYLFLDQPAKDWFNQWPQLHAQQLQLRGPQRPLRLQAGWPAI